jgi:site-specific recombinase XerD
MGQKYWNPGLGLVSKPGPSGKKYPAEHYTRLDCLAVLDACPDTWYGQRNRALIVVLWRSGLRIAEALALREKDFDFEARAIRVLHGKKDKARTVGMDRHEVEEVKKWIRLRGPQASDTPVFCTRKGNPIPQSYIRALLPELARRANIYKRVHAHGFRHTYAVDLMREGIRVRDIQVLLGHANLGITSVYLASLSPEEALDAVRGREW